MGIFSNIFKRFFIGSSNTKISQGSSFDYLLYNSNSTSINSKAMLLSTVYRCTDIISDSVAQLPFEPYIVDRSGYKIKYIDHPTYRLLNKEPNSYMSRFTFLKTLIVSVLLKGNGFAYIKRNDLGDATELIYIDPDSVLITKDKNGIKYRVEGVKGYIESCNMIHILNFSYDGITGISTLEHARKTLGLAMDSESHAAGFFKGGANMSGILKVNSTLNPKQKQDLKTSWMSAFSPNEGNPNGIAVLEGNMDFQPVTVNPSDAQLLETRQFNVVDICRFFGVSPVKAFDLSKSSYSTVEATQLAFLTDTLNPLLEKIELEFERKLYKPSEKNNIEVRFDTSNILRSDKASLASYYNTLFQIGVVTTNEVRKALDLPAIENGDNTFVQVNVQTLSNAIQQTQIKQENNEEGKGN